MDWEIRRRLETEYEMARVAGSEGLPVEQSQFERRGARCNGRRGIRQDSRIPGIGSRIGRT